MNETAEMLAEATNRLLQEWLDEAAVRRARSGEWLAGAWAAVEEMGLPLVLVSEDAGGFGVAPEDAFALVRLAGAAAAPLPIGETMIANRALALAGLALAEGPAAIATEAAGLTLTREGGGWRLRGKAARVAWGRHAATLVAEVDGKLVRLSGGWETTEMATNVAQEPRDTLAIDAFVDAHDVAPGGGLLLAGATIRALQIAGALQTIVGLTVGHVNERVQFGRALAKFQAIQHELAKAAGEMAASRAAADMAAEALAGDPAAAWISVAAARVRTGEAVGVATSICHQLHGAIGFTEEHRLHLFTTALWAWRDEYGGQAYWTKRLGGAALAAGAQGYWPFVVAA